MTDRNIYIVYNGVRYKLAKGRNCTEHCSFRKAVGPYYCEGRCYLPQWIKRFRIGVNYWLERVDPKVELLNKVKRDEKREITRTLAQYVSTAREMMDSRRRRKPEERGSASAVCARSGSHAQACGAIGSARKEKAR